MTNNTSSTDMPDGWTDNYEVMSGDSNWGDKGVGTLTALHLGLAKPTPKLGQLTYTGGCLYVFDSNGQLPASLVDIKKLIKEEKMGDMELEDCAPAA
ncbi:hypothetical protein QBC38DRAFT_517345 [Podospora fimiseda]|uniref:Uncharacterized protein n=1 Tax=Podospora fimiseda TaxID=252190 RepID=A0AAN7GU94_9PEZI|nr:hypothetical protein QBC38DRAFT_517345 [Podospora fimiseda]